MFVNVDVEKEVLHVQFNVICITYIRHKPIQDVIKDRYLPK